ncbi:MAG: hypothetical protein LIP02_10950 [Bacteroidales bacterium]|nr:hypothetical protein [Bacteroidales bacterium]
MKKTIFAAFAAIAMAAGFTSCSSDEPMKVTQAGEEVAVTVTATLPGDIQSRAYSDGLKALDMYYAVYEDGVTAPIIPLTKHTEQFSGLTNTLTLHLVTGKTYNVVFWAQSPDAKDSENNEFFTLDTTNSTVTVNYDKIKASLNHENVDAFFCNKPVEVKGAATITAELKRPFAQINVGTNDINYPALKGKEISAKMKVSAVYGGFDLKDGSVIGNASAVEFAKTLRPNNGKETTAADYEAFPVGDPGDYEYLAMAYVLMSADKQTTDVELEFYDGNATDSFHSLSVPGAPVQRNYRTNIFGALLTSTIDFTITIKPAYEGEYAPQKITATPATLPTVLAGLTESTTVYLESGKFTLGTGAGSTVGRAWSDATDWSKTNEEIILEHNAMDICANYTNLKPGITVTLQGEGIDKTAILMSDGNYGVPAGAINGSIRVNGANIVLKNMLVVQRGYTILDATVLTYDNCEIWGTMMAHSETVNFNDCSFWFTERTNAQGLSIQANSQQALMFNSYARYINFSNCEFHANQNKAVQLYATERRNVIQDVYAENCTLYGGSYETKSDSWRSFFEIHTDNGWNLHGKVTLKDCKINESDAAYWGGGVWAFNTSNSWFDVVVDGSSKATSTFTGWDNPWNINIWNQ